MLLLQEVNENSLKRLNGYLDSLQKPGFRSVKPTKLTFYLRDIKGTPENYDDVLHSGKLLLSILPMSHKHRCELWTIVWVSCRINKPDGSGYHQLGAVNWSEFRAICTISFFFHHKLLATQTAPTAPVLQSLRIWCKRYIQAVTSFLLLNLSVIQGV